MPYLVEMMDILVARLMRLVTEAIGGVTSSGELENTISDAAPIGRYHVCKLNSEL